MNSTLHSMTATRGLAGVLLLGGLALCCCAPAEDSPASRRSPILAGEQDLADLYPQVMTAGHASLLCSGALIAPDLVLTAHHCVSRPEALVTAACDPDFSPGAASNATLMFPVLDKSEILIGRGITDTGAYLTVAALHHRPDWQSAQMCGNDLAIVQLAEPLLETSPLPLRLWLPPLTGEPLTVVGYGQVDPDQPFSTGKRRFRSDVSVESVGRVMKDAASWRTVDSEFIITEGACGGDSGGPALDTSGALVGVMSRGKKSTCEQMIYGQIPTQADWLTELIIQSHQRAGQTPPIWTTRPAASSTALGETCGAADQCAPPLSCRPIQGVFTCVQADCEACPEGWSCADDDTQTAVCGAPPLPLDSGVTSDMDTHADTGRSPDAGPATDAGGYPQEQVSGCHLLPGAGGGFPLAFLSFACWFLAFRRRRG